MRQGGRSLRLLVAAAALAGAAAGCHTGGAGDGAAAGKQVVFDRVPAAARLTLSSADVTAGRPIPERFSDYGAGQTPTIRWSAPPAGTKSVAFLVEDPDAPGAQPFVHWVVYGIPPGAANVGPTLPPGAAAGTNSAGTAGYFGPHPPQGDPPHHYHFETFALDTTPRLTPRADRDTLAAAMAGHVLAKGEMVATYGGR